MLLGSFGVLNFTVGIILFDLLTYFAIADDREAKILAVHLDHQFSVDQLQERLSNLFFRSHVRELASEISETVRAVALAEELRREARQLAALIRPDQPARVCDFDGSLFVISIEARASVRRYQPLVPPLLNLLPDFHDVQGRHALVRVIEIEEVGQPHKLSAGERIDIIVGQGRAHALQTKLVRARVEGAETVEPYGRAGGRRREVSQKR